jgi:hypothetical protein
MAMSVSKQSGALETLLVIALTTETLFCQLELSLRCFKILPNRTAFLFFVMLLGVYPTCAAASLALILLPLCLLCLYWRRLLPMRMWRLSPMHAGHYLTSLMVTTSASML